MPPVETITAGINHAANQSDRWLMVAAFVLAGVAVFFAVRWLAAQYNRILDVWRNDMKGMHEDNLRLHSERVKAADAYAAELRAIQKESSDSAKEIVRLCAEALARNAEVMGSVHTALRDLQNSCAVARGTAAAFHSPPRHGAASA